jgi:hypothetical protein
MVELRAERCRLSPGEGDYLEWQDHLLGDASEDELYEKVQEHRQRPWEEMSSFAVA